MSMRVESGYVTASEVPLYGTRYRDGATRGTALLLPPFGEERKCAARLLHETSLRVASLGYEVMRMDWRGLGESLGSLADVSLADWRDDIRAVANVVGTPSLVIGARLGANLALAAGDPASTTYVLWEPLTSGSEYLAEMIRRKQVKEMMTAGKAASEAMDVETAWAGGEAVDFDGFAIGARMAAELRTLDLATSLADAAWNRLLLAHVTGARRLTGAWAMLEGRCASWPGVTMQLVREKPFWGRTDTGISEDLLRETMDFIG